MQPAARPRNIRIEALRLVAICAIAIFHSFQPVFASVTAHMTDPALAVDGVGAALVQVPVAAGLLGAINLLGAYGNCVFFAISGFFLIPSAARASRADGHVRSQARRTARRAATIGVSVGLYAIIALIVSRWIVSLPGIAPGEFGWLVGGLEFIWVYLATMLVTPLIGWIWERCRARLGAVAAIVVIVYAVNAYIAFISPGDEVRGLLEWRKLMSAVSYLVAYLAGGALADLFGKRPGHLGTWRRGLLGVCAVSLVGEVALACAGRADLMVATSFKSTSVVSFALAWLSLAVCAHPDALRIDPDRASARLVARAASCILGFYIAQSMFQTLWRGPVDAAMMVAAAVSSSAPLASALILIAGILASLAVVAVFLLIDSTLRRPLLRALHLTA